MMENPARARRRVQFSVRSLLIVTALLALALVPLVWVMRERRQVLRAREEAIRSVLLAERRRTQLRAKGAQSADEVNDFAPDAELTEPPPPVSKEILIEHLRRENNELKDTVDSLRQEVERLRAANRRAASC